MARTPLFKSFEKITRREFLKASAVTLAGLALGVMPAQMQARPRLTVLPSAQPERFSEPVVIVGAGLAGLTTAYKLQQAGVPVVMYEASNRIGGRTFTRRNFNADGMFCELGGELVDTSHEALHDLCAEVGVSLQRIADPTAPTAFYFDGRHYTDAEVVTAFRPLARAIERDILSAFPNGEVSWPDANNTYGLEAFDRVSVSAYLDAKRAADAKIPAWLVSLLKIAYTGEFGLEADEQSAINIMLLIGTQEAQKLAFYGESDEAFRIAGGSDTLATTLYDKISDEVTVQFKRPLRCLSTTVDGRFTLVFDAPNGEMTVTAARVVLAVPLPILRQIEAASNLALPDVTRRAIRELGFGTNAKQMMGFSERVWPFADAFTDAGAQCFWDTSRGQDGRAGIITNFIGGKAGENLAASYLFDALDQFEAVLPGSKIKFDGSHARMVWTQQPHTGGSYLCPKVGQYTTLMGAFKEVLYEGRLQIAGEHASAEGYGFMNGAVDSGLVAAKNILTQAGYATAVPS